MSISKRDAIVSAVDAGTVDPVFVVDALLEHIPDSAIDAVLARFPVIQTYYEEHKSDR